MHWCHTICWQQSRQRLSTSDKISLEVSITGEGAPSAGTGGVVDSRVVSAGQPPSQGDGKPDKDDNADISFTSPKVGGDVAMSLAQGCWK